MRIGCRDEGDTFAQARMRDEFLRDSLSGVVVDGPSPWDAYLGQVSSRIRSGFVVLDIGAGTGHALVHLLDMLGDSFTAVGLDISLGMIEVARDSLVSSKRGCLVRGDADRLPLDDRSIDMALCRLAPYDGAECFRSLRPGGWLFLVTTGRDDWREIREGFGQFEKRSVRDHAGELGEVGFVDVVEEAFSFHEHYPFESMVDVVEFVPVVEGFLRDRDLPLLRSIAGKHQTKKGVRITRVVNILRAKKPDTV